MKDFPWKNSGLFSWIIIELLRIWSMWNLFSKEYFVCISDIGYCMVSMIYHFHLYKMHQNPNGIIHNHIFSRQLPSIASENQWMLDNCKNFYQYQVQFAIKSHWALWNFVSPSRIPTIKWKGVPLPLRPNFLSRMTQLTIG